MSSAPAAALQASAAPGSVVPLGASHAHAAPLVLASAFLDDPVLGRHLFRQDAFKASGAALFFAHLLHAQGFAAAGVSHVHEGAGGAVQGCALWQAPGAPQGLPLPAMLRMLLIAPSVFGFGGVLRALRTGAAVDAAHPHTRHYYLAFLGVLPSAQGKGIGAALLRPVLARADAEGVPCYLENSNAANLPFYSRAGFRVVREVTVGSTAAGEPVKVYCMQREPNGDGRTGQP